MRPAAINKDKIYYFNSLAYPHPLRKGKGEEGGVVYIILLIVLVRYMCVRRVLYKEYRL